MDEDQPSRLRVLVVERDLNVRELEAHFLNEAGYETHFADDGRDALAKATETPPDILVTEILVPHLDGLALCRAIKGNPATRHVRVLIFSILSAKVRAQEAGADAFLNKPLSGARLVDMMKRLQPATPSA